MQAPPHAREVEICVDGAESFLMAIHDPGMDIGVSAELDRHGVWEPLETSVFLHLAAGARLFWDLGANVGYYTLLACHMHEGPRSIVAVEPEQSNFALLERNLKASRAVRCRAIRAACSDAGERLILDLSESNFGDHRTRRLESGDGREPEATVGVTPNELLAMHDGTCPDIVKIDTQGAEFSILRGLRAALGADEMPAAIIFELWPFGLEEFGEDRDELEAIIGDREPILFALFEDSNLILTCTVRDLKRWWAGVLSPESRRYINVIMLSHAETAGKLADTFSQRLAGPIVLDYPYRLNGQSSFAGLHLVPVGWSYFEEHGIWTDGDVAEVLFDCPVSEALYVFEITFTPFVAAAGHSQAFSIIVDGMRRVTVDCHRNQSHSQKVVFRASSQSRTVVTLECHRAVAPSTLLPDSSDDRKLGLRLEGYRLSLLAEAPGSEM